MSGLTLADLEQEISDLASEAEDEWDMSLAEKLRSLARRIAVQIVNNSAA